MDAVLNCVISKEAFKISIYKLQFKFPHVIVENEQKLSLLRKVDKGQNLQISFRSWDLHEYPTLPMSNSHSWIVKTSSQLEKPRFIIFALQNNKKDKKEEDSSKFDHCNVSDFKIYLNSEAYPYEDLNVKFSENRFGNIYEMYSLFQKFYYYKNDGEPLLTPSEFKDIAPIFVINCSYQNESIKSGPVDIRIEFKTDQAINNTTTTAYCLLIHDRIIEYNPLNNQVRKVL